MSFYVTLVRHGETDFNLDPSIQSQANVCLNATGVAQSEALGLRFADEKFTKVYTSDLIRAHETANFALGKSNHPPPEIVLDTNLRERDMGEWDAQGMKKTLGELLAKLKDSNLSTENGEYLQLLSELYPPGGDTQEQLMARINAFFEELCQACDDAKEPENVLVVSHGIWIVSFFVCYLQANQGNKFKVHGLDSSRLALGSLSKGGLKNTCVSRFAIHKISPGKGKDCQRKIVFDDFLDSSHLS